MTRNKTALVTSSVFVFILVFLTLLTASANVTVCPLFSTNMVLQRNKAVPVYGTAAPGESVTVAFGGQAMSTTADAQGDWRVNLAPMTANTTAQTMTITGANTISITGVVVGDVWLISGQSNMTMPLSASERTQDEASANFPGIRRFSVGQVNLNYPTKSLTGSWTVCSPSTAGSFPGTGFYFARKIYQDQDGSVPIGLLQAARGSTDIDVWVPQESIANIPLLKPLLNPSSANWPPFCFFNGMIYPLEPYGIYGVIWWQGCGRENTSQSVDSYYVKERAVVQGWRHLWGGEEMPFYIVQLANYEAAATGPTPDLSPKSRADTRVQQANILGLPRTGMAVAIDVGDATNIHPPDKMDIGERLALWALKNDYGRSTILESGPILRDVVSGNGKLICSFDYVGSGLMVGAKVQYQPTQEVANGKLARFSIAGSDGVWSDANAVIVGDTVEVSSPAVMLPTKVAYAHWPNPTGCNLYNKEGLPASPFFVDDVNAKYTVTATTGSGGSISPAGPVTYLKRKTALYTITPEAGYFIADVLVDGVSVGAVRHYSFDPLYANHTIAASFTTAAPTYTITASAGAGGALSLTGTLTVGQGGSQAFKVIPNAGCYIDTVTVDDIPVGSRSSFTFADVRANHKISASFECKITATVGYGGAITPAGVTDVPYGTNKTFTITPNPGFTTTNVQVDGSDMGVISTHTFTNVTGPHTILATFSGGGGTQDGIPRIYDLLFSVNTDSLPASGNTGNWATYIPSGKSLTAARGTPSVEVINGVKWEKNLYADYDGYKMGPYSNPIITNGASVVMAIRPVLIPTRLDDLYGVAIFNDRLALGFKANTGQVFLARNGATSLSTYALTDGQPVILSMVAQPDGRCKVWVNGTQVMDVTDTNNITKLTPSGNSNYITLADSETTGAHTFNGNIGDTFVYLVPLDDAERQQLEANLTDKFAGGTTTTYTITASTGTGGTITPGGTVTVSQGASKTFTITPAGGYVIADVKVDGDSVGTAPTYTFNSVASSHIIYATFTAVPASTITASTGPGGSITPSGAVLVNHGASQTFAITPNVGYVISDVTADDTSAGAVPSYTFSNVTKDHSIFAAFRAVPPLTISASAGNGGSVSPSGAVSVEYGANQKFTITPSAGYKIADVQVDDSSIGVVTSYTFNKVTADHVFNADFIPVPTFKITASMGAGGSISPSGTVSVISGDNQTFVVTPNVGYTIADVKVDDVSVGAVPSYTFSGVTAAHTIQATFSAITTGVPRTDQLVGSWTTDSLPASGSISSWTSYMPSGQTFVKMGSPTVSIVDSIKWANNHYSSSDGFDLGLYPSTYSLPCNGASVVMAVRPVRNAIKTDWVACFNVFTYTLSFGIRNDTGALCARRNSSLFSYNNAIIPDGQTTILSGIVQPDGTFKIYANGTQMVDERATATGGFTQIAPTTTSTDSSRHICLGRANPAQWSCFNGYIGDTYFYKVALSTGERQQLEALLTAKFMPPAYQDVARISDLKTKADGVPVRLAGTSKVIYAPRGSDGTRTTTFFYIGEAQGLGGLRVVDKTTDSLVLGNQITNLTGYVRKPAGGEVYLELTADPVGLGSSLIHPIGVSNRSLIKDPFVPTNAVVTWGRVKTISGTQSFTIDDGCGTPVTVKVNGVDLPAGLSSTDIVTITGVVGADRTVQAQTIMVVR